MSKKQTIWIVIISIIIFLLYLTPNLIYYCKFHANGVSSSPEQWGQYGDFIGGSLNPILTVFNIIALVYLTYIVSHLEDKRTKQQINVQKLITLNQMRYEAVKELSKQLDTNYYNQHVSSFFQKLYIQLGLFRANTKYLFEELYEGDFDIVFFTPLLKSIENYKERFAETEQDDELANTLSIDYIRTKVAFIGELNRFILKELSKTE